MRAPNTSYRKNFSLIVAFLILVSVTLFVALYVAYQITAQNVENDFASKKNRVAERTFVNPYNDLYKNRIPIITSYSGSLDSVLALEYADTIFSNFSFVRKIVFFQITVGNPPSSKKKANNLGMRFNAIHQYYPPGQRVPAEKNEATINENDFRQMADRLSDYIAAYDTSRGARNEDQAKFYLTRPGKVSFLNIPNNEDLKVYHDLQRSGYSPAYYKQNMFTFYLDPQYLRIINTNPELYEDISIKQFVYDPPDIDRTQVLTDEVALSGAMSDYKLYFKTSRSHLRAEANRRFAPAGGIIVLVYFFFVLIGWLIYRNLNVNLKLFKLQYDFINNFTHEFKTPVSVIKIAGSNLRGDNELTERQRKHYGKILDEEADKLNELMNKLLSFTQLENKSIKIKKDKINVTDFVKSYIDTFTIKYPDFKLDYKIKNAQYFETDAVLLGSIFQNLMENAYKYSHPQQKTLFINVSVEKRNIIFSFIDNGIGIPKSELNNIFRKFYRLENQYNKNGSVGLGLAFCKELVNFMNGTIIVKSKVNEGSEFTITLPYEN
ncbi:sensor histidine kinase [Mucilaginibacter calamicampi]|uniref:histidine kinase n=1 Tax=Mucilaginibacter calamicampi TaxID=1302352 RepID=A0ABW2Z399_9SPHI